MALMKLLTVTRSLSEARDEPHRYKLMSGGWPKFGSSVVERSGVAAAEVENRAMNTETIAQQNAAAVKHAYPHGRWTTNPFRSTALPSKRSVMQGELSLDQVKPLRNDLSDSDLELIPRKQEEKNVFAAPAPEAQLAQKLSLFSRMKARLFRSKAS
jgi:hypothetical protein